MADNKMLIEFAGTIDASLKTALGQITSLMSKLDLGVAKLADSISHMSTGSARASKELGKAGVAAKSMATSMSSQAAAMENTARVSTKYLNLLDKINGQFKEGTTQRGHALRAAQKTEAAWQRETKAIRIQAKELKTLQNNMQVLNETYSHQTTKRGAEKVQREIAATAKSIGTLQDGMRSAATSLGKSYDYMGKFADSFSKIQRTGNAVLSDQTRALLKTAPAVIQYQNALDNLRASYDGNSKSFAAAVRGLNKTDAAYRRELGVTNDRTRALAKLDAQISKLNKAQSAQPFDTGKYTKSISELTTKAAELRASINDTVKAIDKSFNYTGRLGQEIARVRDEMTSSSRQLARYTAEHEGFQKIARRIVGTTAEGSRAQKMAFGELDKMINNYNTTNERIDNNIIAATKRMKGASEDARIVIQNNIRAMQQEKAAQTAALTTAPHKTFNDFKSGAAEAAKAMAKLNTQGTAFESVQRSMESRIKSGSISIQTYAKEVAALGTAIKKVDSIGARYGKTAAQMDAAVSSVGATRIHQDALNKTWEASAEQLKRQLNLLPKIRKEYGLVNEIAGTLRSVATYAVAGAGIYSLFSAFSTGKNAIIEYNQSLKDLQAITQASDSDIELLGETILTTASKYKFGLSTVTEAAKIIGQAGFSASETMSVLNSTMELAQGTMSGIKETADLITTAMTAFQEEGLDAAKAADILAQSVNLSKLDIEKLRTVFNYVGPVANDAGVSFQEVAAALTVLANQGMRSSTIGTSLRNIFARLESPNAKLRIAFKDNAEALAAIADESTGLSTKFKILGEVLGKETDLFQIFGLRAAGAVSILMRFPDEIDRMNEALYSLGMAEKMAEKQMEGLSNKFENLRTRFEIFAVAIGKDAGQGLGAFVDVLRGAMSVLTSVADTGIGQATVKLAAFTLAIGAAITVVRVMGVLFSGGAITAGLAAMGTRLIVAADAAAIYATGMTSATIATTRFGTATAFLVAHPVVAAIAAIAAVIGVVALATSKSSTALEKSRKESDLFLKQKREELSLLERASEANAVLAEDSVERTLNAYHVARKIPAISGITLNTSKDEVQKILDKFKVDTAAEVTNALVLRIKTEQERLIILRREVEALGRQAVSLDGPTRLPATSFMSGSIGYSPTGRMTNEEQSALKGAEVSAIQEKRLKLEQEMAVAIETTNAMLKVQHDVLLRDMRAGTITLEEYKTKIYDIANGAMPAFVGKTDAAAMTTKRFYEMTVETLVELAEYAEQLKKQQLGDPKAVEAVFAQSGVEGVEQFIAMYEELPQKMQFIFLQLAEKTAKAVEKVPEGLAPKDELRWVQTQWEELFANLTQDYLTYNSESLKGAELRMQRELRLAIDTSETKEELAKQEADIRKRYGEEGLRDAEKQAFALVNILATMQQVKLEVAGLSTEQVIKLVLEADVTKLPPALQDFVKNNAAALSGQQQLILGMEERISSATKKDKFTGGGARTRFGSEARKKIDALQEELSAEDAILELHYEKGLLTYQAYLTQRTEMQRKLMAAREGYVQELQNKATSEEDKATAEKELQQLRRDRAKFELDAIQDTRNAEYALLERNHAYREAALNKELASIDTLNTSYLTILQKEQAAAEAITESNIETLNTKLEMKNMNEQDRAGLLLELEKEYTSLIKQRADYQKKMWEEATKYIEYEYRVGLASAKEYVAYLEKSKLLGNIDPYEADQQRVLATGTPFEAFRLGLGQAKEGVQSLQESVAGLAGIADSTFSSMSDRFVESWHDSSISVQQEFHNLLVDMVVDMEKTLFKNFMQTILYGAPGDTGGGSNGILGFLTGGFGANKAAAGVQTKDDSGNILNNMTNSVMASFNSMQGMTATAQQGMVNATVEGANINANAVLGMADNSTNIFAKMGNGILGMVSSLGQGVMGALSSLGGGGGGGGGFLNALGGLLVNSIGGFFGGGSSTASIGSKISASVAKVKVMHAGGIVGAGNGWMRNVSPEVFNTAQRYHNGGIVGLKEGEVPIIAQKGERIIPAGASEAVTVNIHNYGTPQTSTQQTQRRDSSGGLNIDLLVEDIDRRQADRVMKGQSHMASAIDSTRGLSAARGK